MEKQIKNGKKYNFTEEVYHYKGKFLQMSTKKYTLEGDETKKIEWECVNRTNIEEHKKVYGAEVIGLIKNASESSSSDLYSNLSLLLIENYRYPVEKRVLEFPSGLIENTEYGNLHNLYMQLQAPDLTFTKKEELQSEYNENLKKVAVSSAARELKEETGYHGKFKSFLTLPGKNPINIFENIFFDPWKSLENAFLCIFEIDKSLEENKNPVQELDDCEIIKTYEVKLSNLLEFITEKIEKENYGCSEHVYTFAIGLQFKEMLQNFNLE